MRGRRVLTLAVLVSLVPAAAACANTAGSVGLAVTVSDGQSELLVAPCGGTPDRLVVMQYPPGETPALLGTSIPDPGGAVVVADLTDDELGGDESAVPLELEVEPGAAPQGVVVYIEDRGLVGESWSSRYLPDEQPWPDRPHALTERTDFALPMRLGTDKGALCG